MAHPFHVRAVARLCRAEAVRARAVQPALVLQHRCGRKIGQALRELLPELLAASAETVGWRVARRPYLIGYGYTPENVRERRSAADPARQGRLRLSQKVHEGHSVPEGNVDNARTGSLFISARWSWRADPEENKYSTLESGPAGRVRKTARAFTSLIFTPPIYFLRLYFRNGLWRCGLSGFIEAMTGAVYGLPDGGEDLPAARSEGAPECG